jgi:hypothetical protein
VISGRAAQVARMHELISINGPEPNAWLDPFMAENARRPIAPSQLTGS